ncbi:UNKNOWN [Stylonychia lemnae]|uniref:Uncharacterized protein n=1 Tax=Stylonychia lemnae TaxID=5949 RepID=A0A078A5S3_STYLE|nr:UNKNOWN [Stylonychia lemnae]|eukprot:CDW76895.1 UNKNOWN [Stylonychia lemnae]
MKLFACPLNEKACMSAKSEQVAQLGKNYEQTTNPGHFNKYSICFWSLQGTHFFNKTDVPKNARLNISIDVSKNVYTYIITGQSPTQTTNQYTIPESYNDYNYSFPADQIIYLITVAYEKQPQFNFTYGYYIQKNASTEISCSQGLIVERNGTKVCNNQSNVIPELPKFPQRPIKQGHNETLNIIQNETQTPRYCIILILCLNILGFFMYFIVKVLEKKYSKNPRKPKVQNTEMNDFELKPLEEQVPNPDDNFEFNQRESDGPLNINSVEDKGDVDIFTSERLNNSKQELIASDSDIERSSPTRSQKSRQNEKHLRSVSSGSLSNLNSKLVENLFDIHSNSIKVMNEPTQQNSDFFGNNNFIQSRNNYQSSQQISKISSTYQSGSKQDDYENVELKTKYSQDLSKETRKTSFKDEKQLRSIFDFKPGQQSKIKVQIQEANHQSRGSVLDNIRDVKTLQPNFPPLKKSTSYQFQTMDDQFEERKTQFTKSQQVKFFEGEENTSQVPQRFKNKTKIRFNDEMD